MQNQWSLREVHDVEQWTTLFEKVPSPYLGQAYSYGKAVNETKGYGVRLFSIERMHDPVAICQVRTRYVAKLPLASHIQHGPMFFDPAPSYETKKNVLQLVRNNWRVYKRPPVKIQPAIEDTEENNELLLQLGFKKLKGEPWWSSRIDLSLDKEELKKRLEKSWRKQLNGATRRGLSLRTSNSLESVQWLIRKHEEVMHEKGFEEPSAQFLTSLYCAAPNEFFVFQVLLEDRPVAAACWIKYGSVAQSFVGWFGPEGRTYNAGNFLYWNALLEMKKAECKWGDLGGLHLGHGYTSFKQNMRGTEYKLCGNWLCY